MTVEGVHFLSANGAAHIKTGLSRGGYVTNVVFRDLTFADGAALQDGILVDAFYHATNPSCPSSWRPAAPTRMANFSFLRIEGSRTTCMNSPFHFKGVKDAPITGVRVDGVHLPTSSRGLQSQWLCQNVSGSVVDGSVTPWPPCKELSVVAAWP